MGERGREAGRALTEVRTVLSRARTALRELDQPTEWHRLPKPDPIRGIVDCGEPPIDFTREKFNDPDIEQMRDALQQVVDLLTPWEKTGKTHRWVQAPAEDAT